MPALSCSAGGRSLHNATAPSCLTKKMVPGQNNFANYPDYTDTLASRKADGLAGQFFLQMAVLKDNILQSGSI